MFIHIYNSFTSCLQFYTSRSKCRFFVPAIDFLELINYSLGHFYIYIYIYRPFITFTLTLTFTFTFAFTFTFTLTFIFTLTIICICTYSYSYSFCVYLNNFIYNIYNCLNRWQNCIRVYFYLAVFVSVVVNKSEG